MARLPKRKIAEQWLRDILRVLYQHRGLTRYEINELTGLNAGSSSLALGHLLDSGTILKVGELKGEVGRKRDFFSLNPEAGFFVAMDLEGRALRFALCNLLGDVRYRWDEDLHYGQPLQFHTVCEGINRVVASLEERQLSRLFAVGVSYPGLLDQAGRLSALNLGWHKFPLARELKRAANLPVFLEHDIRSCVMAERWLGRARKYSNALFVLVERGVGLGILLDGNPVEGWRNMSGELGHCTADPGAADRCSCGRAGCVEAIASSGNIVRQYLERTGQSGREVSELRVTHVFEKARRNDTVALEVLDRAARALGSAVANAVNLLNPQIVIFGGDIIAGADVALPIIKAEMLGRVLPELSEGLEITMSSLGFDIRLKGAASLAFRGSLADRVILRRMCAPL